FVSLCCANRFFVFFFFFFQAEDGIRDFHVTGVQTCALPISERGSLEAPDRASVLRAHLELHFHFFGNRPRPHGVERDEHPHRRRSEERRVGKECRAQWSQDHEKKKQG